ncbi:MAG TPA: MEDS domain-containing protein [Nitrospira sp.]|nr:MEDS domain-containing protein [Nitrospira sp.]
MSSTAAARALTTSLRRVGIAGVEPVSWDEHLCAFYRSRAELVDLVVPFVKAGLEDGEFCIWMTGGPIREGDAMRALQRAVPDLPRYIEAKQVEIVAHDRWRPNGAFDAEPALGQRGWPAGRAAKRFAGLRTAGNPCSLADERGGEFSSEYETWVREQMGAERMMALCTYPAARCDPFRMLQTLACHGTTLLPKPHARGWQRAHVL